MLIRDRSALFVVTVIALIAVLSFPTGASEYLELVNKGNTFAGVGRYQEALNAFDNAIEIDPNNSEAWVGKGEALRIIGRNQESIDAFNKAIEIDPNNAFAWRSKGIVLTALGRNQEAITAIDRAMELDPNYLDALQFKGYALKGLGKQQEAAAVFQRIIELSEKLILINQDDFILWHQKGNALHNLGKYQEAVDAYDKAIKLNPNDAWTWDNKGNPLFALGRYQEAVDAHNNATKLNPNVAWFWLNKGKALDALGKNQEANEAYKKAYELTATGSAQSGGAFGAIDSFSEGLKYFSVMGIISLVIIAIILSFEKREKNKPKFREDLKTRHRSGYYLILTGQFIMSAIFFFISSIIAFKELPIIFDYNKFIFFAIPMLYLSVSSFIIAVGLLTSKPNTKLNKVLFFLSLISGISFFAALGDSKTPVFLPFLPLISAGLSVGYDRIAIFKPVSNQESSSNEEITVISIPATNKETPIDSLSGEVDAKTAFGYKGATIIYKVKIENDTFDPISDIKVYPYVPDVFLLIDKEKLITLIEPKKSQTATFEIRPTGECGDCNVSGRINYYNTALRKRQDIDIETKSLSIVCPILHRKEISEDAWDEMVSELVKAEEATKDIPIESEGLFKIISEILKDMNLFTLSPSTNKTPQIFRGTARFYGEGAKGLRYATAIEVIGGIKKSKLILKAWAEKEDSLTGFYHGLLDSINTRIDVKEYINEPINNYYVQIGHTVGPGGKVIDIGDKKIDASGLKEALSEIDHTIESEGKIIDIGDKSINSEKGNSEDKTLKSTNIRKCQNCGKVVHGNEKYCLSCGANLAIDDSPALSIIGEFGISEITKQPESQKVNDQRNELSETSKNNKGNLDNVRIINAHDLRCARTILNPQRVRANPTEVSYKNGIFSFDCVNDKREKISLKANSERAVRYIHVYEKNLLKNWIDIVKEKGFIQFSSTRTSKTGPINWFISNGFIAFFATDDYDLIGIEKIRPLLKLPNDWRLNIVSKEEGLFGGIFELYNDNKKIIVDLGINNGNSSIKIKVNDKIADFKPYHTLNQVNRIADFLNNKMKNNME